MDVGGAFVEPARCRSRLVITGLGQESEEDHSNLRSTFAHDTGFANRLIGCRAGFMFAAEAIHTLRAEVWCLRHQRVAIVRQNAIRLAWAGDLVWFHVAFFSDLKNLWRCS
jgi:hypothetical protein